MGVNKKFLIILLMMLLVSMTAVAANNADDVVSADMGNNQIISVEADVQNSDSTVNDDKRVDLADSGQSNDVKEIVNKSDMLGADSSDEILGASGDNDKLGASDMGNLKYTIERLSASGGTITLSDNYIADDSRDANIVINCRGFTLEGNNHYIDANGKGRIFQIGAENDVNAYNIVFKNLIFRGGSADKGSAAFLYQGAHDVTFINCTFENNVVSYSGGTISAADTGGFSNVKFHGCTFKNNRATYSTNFGGAAIFLIKTTGVEIINCSFIGNNEYSTSGGAAVYLRYCVDVLVNNSVFTNNVASRGPGGAIVFSSSNNGLKANFTVDNCKFSGNVAKQGGAISVSSNPFTGLEILNSNFTRNNAGDYGGAICTVTETTDITIRGCNFDENSADTTSASYGGGAVYSASRVKIYDSNFTGNTANLGGGVYSGKNGLLEVHGSNFKDNVARTDGRSIYVYSTSKQVTIDGCEFDDYDAVCVAGTATINDNKEIKTLNTDNYAVYVANGGKVSLSNNNFTNLVKNYGTIDTEVTATVCGNSTYYRSIFVFPLEAILLDDNNNTVVSNQFKFTTTTLDQKTVIHNSRMAEDKQKADDLVIQYAYYFIDATDAGIPNMVTRPTILNIIPNVGSYTWLQTQIDNFTTGSVFVLTHNVTFDAEYDLSPYNSYVIKGVNFRDGVKYNRTMSFDGNGSTISGNNQARIFDVRVQTSSSLEIKDTNFVNASTDKDGGALNVAISNLHVTKCNFTNNAARDGGAIYCSANGLTVDYCNFDKNRASDEGASIYLKASNLVGGLTISNDNFTSNVAANSGGAIAGINGYNIVITDSNFIANKAETMYGGSIKWDNCGGLTISSSVFKDNTAASAGAIDINDGSGAHITDCYFENNNATSQRGGAVVVWTSLNLELKDSTFISNHALNDNLGFGGAVYTSGNRGNYINNTFENNTAQSGGAMYFYQTSNIYMINSLFNRNNATADGGAVYLSGSYSTFENLNFTNNRAGGKGGALVFLTTAEGDLINSNFINNTALGDGGAVVISGAGEVLNSKFEENTANGFGGAIMGLETTGYQVRDSEFRKNVAYNGGGMYISKADSCPVINSTFYYNNATHNGGAIYLITDNGDTFVDYNFFENNAQPTGDGRYTWARNGYSGDSYLYLNRILLKGNLDYFINASAFAISYSSAYLTVTIPKDANKRSNAKVIISVMDSVNGSVVYSDTIDDELSFITHPGSVEETIFNVTSERWYNVTVIFYDDYYRHKEITTRVLINISDPNAGQFKKLQRLINEFIQNHTSDPLGEEFDIPYAFTYDPLHDIGQINITAPIIINGHGRLLDADGFCRIFYINSTNVTLKDIVFINGNVFGRDNYTHNNTLYNGGGVYLDAEGVVIDKCYFYDNVAEYGAGLYVNTTAADTTLINCNFNNNNATYNGGAIDCNAPKCSLTNTIFTSNIAGEYGAALCREIGATNGSGYNNTFTSNRAGIAGAALGWMGAEGIFIDTYFFYANTAGKRGGAIYVSQGSQNCTIYNSTFEGNRVDVGGTGGAVDSLALNLTIEKSSFKDNSANDGGALYVGATSGNARIIFTDFADNLAYNNGGAINIQASSTLLNYTVFTNNRAVMEGGALYVGGTGQMNDIYSSIFTQNVAEGGNGGAINWVASAGHIHDSNFTDNSAIYGGAVYMGGSSSNSCIEHVYFINNTALKNGGAIDWNSTGGNLSYTTFTGNVADYGAALCRESNATEGFGQYNTFIANHARISGAALGWMHAQGITITNYTFTNNTAEKSGGAIYIGPESHYCNIIDSEFTGNHVTNFESNNYGGAIDCQASNTTIRGSTFDENYAVSGGAIYIASPSGTTNISGSKFNDNNATRIGGAIALESSAVMVNESSFNNNLAKEGGAIYVGGLSIINYIYSSNFTDNNATNGNGGAINWIASSGHIIDSRFIRNHAIYGGGVYMGGNSENSTISNAIFVFNTAVKNGGAIDWNASYGNLSNTEFTGNVADYGAALCREAGAIGGFGTGNGFISNHARIAGAALGWMGSVGININNYFFYNNTADVSGGAIYVGPNSANCTVNNSIFWSNSVTDLINGFGGAIDCEAENLTSLNTTFRENKAAYGGAIWIGSDSGHSIIDNSTFFLNEAYYDGGAINLRASSVSVNDTHFYDNNAVNGGALFVGGMGLTNNITYSTFTNNHANGGRGGAIDWVASTGNILYSNFTYNGAQTGGAVYIGGTSYGSRISTVRFVNNTADGNGGAIDWNATGGELFHTIFIGNIANYGAALCREVNSTGGSGYNNTFDSNHARISGAALGWLGAQGIKIDTYYFWNNTADVSGGSIYVGEGSDGCQVLNSEFKDGLVRSGRGGDIDWIADDGYVYNTTFYGASSSIGGSIYVDAESNNTQIVNSSFNSCSVLGDGGVIAWFGPNGKITDVDFLYMAATNGGGIYGSAENMTITNSTFGYGTSWMGFQGSNEYKGSGSAIYWFDSKRLELVNVSFNDLEAHAHGAGIAAINCNDSRLYNVTVKGSIALKNGGGVYWIDSSNLTIESCNFTDTAAAFGGGALYLYNVDATVKDTLFNHTQAPWSNGGAMYVHADVDIINSTFMRFEAQNDQGSAIYFESGVSNVNISDFDGINPILISKDANVTLTENNVTNSDVGMYSVWNDGNMWLDNNTFDNYIYNNGTIWTRTYTKMLDNQTLNGTLGKDFEFFATIYDDTKVNKIISVSTLKNNFESGYFMPYNKNVTKITKQGIFVVNGTDSGLKDNVVFIGIIQVRNPSEIELNITQTNQGEKVVITAKVSEKGNFSYSGQITFVLNNGKMATVDVDANGIATWNLTEMPQGYYTVTATYTGDSYHSDAEASKDFIINQRDTWIRIVIENFIWGEYGFANITTNGNGTVLLNMKGRSERYNLTENGTYKDGVYTLIVPFDTLYDPDNYTMSVVYYGDEYYAYQMNQTNFTVFKQNTTIDATPTNITFWGNETITVHVAKNATGYVKVTIPVRGVLQEYVANIDNNGTAVFIIPNLFGGDYKNIPVEYRGDIHYNGNVTYINFTVAPTGNFTMDVKADNITYGQNGVVRVLLPTLADGNVTVYVDGINRGTVNVTNGAAILDNISGLAGGEHMVNVTYNGGVDYAAKNFTNVRFNVTPTIDWKMKIDVDEHPYGQNTSVIITFYDYNVTNRNVTIKIGNHTYYPVNITNGRAVLTLDNVSTGIHACEVIYAGDANYSQMSQKFRLHVTKEQPLINLTFEGDNVTATLKGTNITGNVTFYVNGQTYIVNVTNNVARLDKMAIGNNSVVAIYNGDVNHFRANSADNYSIEKLNSTVWAVVSETVYPNTVEITVNVGENQTGFVKIIVNDEIYIAELNGTSAVFNVTGLNVKEHEVFITYYGDDIFNASHNSTKFNVTKANLVADVIAHNVTVEQNTEFVIVVPNDFKGNVTITVNGTVLYNGTARMPVVISDRIITAGEKNATIAFYGDANYNYTEFNRTFTVYRVTPAIKVEIAEVTYPGNATAIVTVENRANGTVEIFHNGVKIGNGTVRNGTAEINLTRLSGGLHEVTVNFTSTDAYNYNASAVKSFEVKRANSTIIIIRNGTDVIAVVTPAQSGNVTFDINGERFVNVTVGGNATIIGKLIKGDNTVTVIYSGNENYTVCSNVTVLSVPKIKTDLVVNASTVTVGQNTTIDVNMTNVTAGRVLIEINNYNYTVDLDNGFAQLSIALPVGPYSIKVYYLGDGDHEGCDNTTSFDVLNKTVPYVNITVTEFNVEIDSNITFTVDTNSTANLTVRVNGEVVNASADGKYRYNATVAGKYTITAEVDENAEFFAASDSKVVTAYKHVSGLIVTATPEVYIGQTTTINVTMAGNETGKVLIVVNGYTYLVNLSQGKANLTIALPVDNYTAHAYYFGDDKYDRTDNVSAVFKVLNKTAPYIMILPNSQTVEIDGTFVFDVDTNSTGNVTVYVNGEFISVSTDGKYRFDAYYIGEYRIAVFVDENEMFFEASNFTTFNAIRHNSTVNVTGRNVTYGTPCEIEVMVPEAQTGFVRITINGTDINVTVEIVDGVAKFNATGLAFGIYNVTVTYLGDYKYNNMSNSTLINISKANLTGDVIPIDIHVDENTIFVIDVIDDFNGNVSIVVDGITLYNDTAKVPLVISSILATAGEKNATIAFYGDANYNYTEFNRTFSVYRVTPEINVTIRDVTYPGNATAEISMSNNANGTIEIFHNGVKIANGTVTNGVAEINLTRLSGGIHNVTVNFTSTDAYNCNVTAAQRFEVFKDNLTVSISRAGNNVTVTVDPETTGFITLIINGENYTRPIVGGHVVLENALRIGDNSVVAIFEGNENYTYSRDVKVYTGNRTNSTVNVTAENKTYGKPVEITVYAPIAQKGNVMITVNGTDIDVIVELKDGVAKFNATGLDVGRYYVNVTYLGSTTFGISDNYTWFNVTEADLTCDVIAKNVTVEENTAFVIVIPEDFNGNVSIFVNGIELYNDTAKVPLVISSILATAGEKNATIAFYGDANYNYTEFNRTFTVYRVTPAINVTIADVTYPDNATAVINMTNNATGTIEVIYNGIVIGSGAIVNGFAEIDLDQMPGGAHNLTVRFTSSDDYNNDATATARLVVNRAKSTTLISVENITICQNATVTITVSENATGIITVYIDGKAENKTIVDNQVEFNITDLTAGDHDIVAEYLGDVNFTESSYSKVFNVAKLPSSVNVTSTTIDVGQTAVINITGPANYTGSANVTVEGVHYYVTLTNGSGQLTIDNLANGTHHVYVTYLENDRYLESSNVTATVTANKVDTSLTILVENITYGDIAQITFLVPGVEVGNITVNINNVPVNITVAYGIGYLNLANLAADNYTVRANFTGSYMYNAANNTKVFEVRKAVPTMVVIVNDVEADQNATITVYINSTATGNITVVVNGTEYRKAIENGKVVIVTDKLPAGEHIVNVTYEGDRNYTSFNNIESGNVSEINVTEGAGYNMTIVIDSYDIVVEENVTIRVYMPNDTNGKNVTIFIGSQRFNATVVNGVATLSRNITAEGLYLVNATYGDAKYANKTVYSAFRAYRVITPMDIEVNNTVVGNVTKVIVTVPNDIDYNVTIEIDGQKLSAKPVNGKAEFNVTGLVAGNKTVTAIYLGDNKYMNNATTKNFNVTKIDREAYGNVSLVNVTTKDIKVGDPARINITAPSDYNGTAVVNVNGVNYTATITNGVGFVEITKLGADTYDVNVTLAENDKYFSYVNDTEKFTVSKRNSTIEVEFANITLGENAEFNVTVSDFGNVTIEIAGMPDIIAAVEGGINHIIVPNLPVGEYDVTVTYNGNYKYLENTSSVMKFKVSPATPKDGFVVEDLGNRTVIVTVPNNATGNITITIGNNNYTAKINNSVAVLNLVNETPGIKIANVTYSGDTNNEPMSVNKTVKIPKYETPMDIHVDNIVVGGTAHVVVTVTGNITNNVTIEIDGRKYNASVNNAGQAIFDVENLLAGNKTVVAIYDGDDSYEFNATTQTFNVTKISPASHVSLVNVSVEDIFVGDVARINITAPSDYNGTAVVNVDGVNYSVNITNGSGFVEVDKLASNTYNVTVTLAENEKYLSYVNDTESFTVSKLNTTVTIEVQNITYGDIAQLRFIVPGVVLGNITVKINGRPVELKVVNGVAGMDIMGMPADNYTVEANFTGNYKYNATNASKVFEVSKATPVMHVIVNNIAANQNATVTVFINNTATGNVTVKVNGTEYKGKIENGMVVITTNKLPVGSHTINVTYECDGNYTAVNNIDSGNISKVNVTEDDGYSMNITVDSYDIIVEENATIRVYMPDEAAGFVTIYIGNDHWDVPIVGHVAVLSRNITTEGIYLVNATYVNEFVNKTVFSAFRAHKIVPSISIEVNNTVVGNVTKVIVTVPGDADFNVTIEIDGQKLTVKPVNGKAEFDVTGLVAGNKTITAIYAGDNKYLYNANTKNFNVTKISPEAYGNVSLVNVTVEDIYVGDVARINITAPSDYNGSAVVNVDGVNYTATIINGIGFVEITKLGANTYDVNVTLAENDKYFSYVNDTESFTVSKRYSQMTVDFANITVGENAVFIVTVSDFGNLTITIAGEDTVVAVKSGENKIIIPDLKVGTHEVAVIYSGNYKYYGIVSDARYINVNKTKTVPEDFKINDTGNGTIIITAPENVAGNITVVINGENKTVNITNGTAVINILNITNATPGENNITIIYSGDENNTNATFNAIVMVPKWASSINATGINIVEGYDEIVTVNVTPAIATGVIFISIGERGFYANVTGGVAKVILSGLKEGNYTDIVVKYGGSANYTESYTTVSFIVSAKPDIGFNPSTGNGSVIVITVGDNSTNGTIQVIIDNVTYNGTVVNGTAIVNLTNVTPGDHNATIIYTDGNNNTFVYNTTISIPKWKSSINATGINIVEGYDEIVTVNVTPGNATGVVMISIGERGFYANVTGGVAKVILSGLKAGEYNNILVRYDGDDIYNESFTTVSFIVYPKPDIDFNASTGNGSVIVITVGDNSTNGTVIIKINGTEFNTTVINGTAIINLTNVTPGDHNATIIYIDGNNNTFEYNATISIPKWKSSINATGINIVEGYDEIVTVNVTPGNATGIVMISIGERGFYANVTGGVAKVILSGLKAGEYNDIVVRYSGDDIYNESFTTVSFIVSPKPDIDFNASTGNGSVVVITVGDNSTNGTVIIKINGTEFNTTVINGTAIINLTNVTPGDHNATIIYIDGNNNTFEYNATISIPKWKSSINATGISIFEGYDEIVTVNVTPGNATGIVMISIGERGFYANVTDGVAKVILSGLKAGEYNDIVVRYSGDDIYNESFTTVSFIVSPKPDIDFNSSTGNGSVIVITVGDNSTNGTVQVIIDNVTYNGTVVNGTAIVNLTNVTPGDHNATIIYTDGNNNTFVYNTTISIPKWKSSINATGINIVEGYDEIVTVNVTPGNATGIVMISIGERGFYANVTGGVAKVILSGLKAGEYNDIVVRYSGDDIYNESFTTVSFIVSPKPDIDFNASTGNGSVIVITVGDNSTNGTVQVIIDNVTYNGTVVNGTAIVNLTNVTPGDHNATIIYTDGNNNTFEYNTIISVPKWKSSINATGISIVEGYDEIVTVNVTPGNATGVVMISIGERGFYANVTGGVAKVILSGLKAGEYNDIVVRYSGDDIYNESFTTVSFIVAPKPDVDFNTTGGNSSVIVITVGDNSTNGTVQIIIDNVTYNGTVVNGTAIVNLTNVTPGDHNATIIYTDGNNNTFEYNTIISVPKWNAEISASSVNIREGDVEIITIKIDPVNATGVVLVDVGGKHVYANITGGTVQVEVENLKQGTYTAYVTYLGNDHYNNATATTSFRVAEAIKIDTNGTGNGTDLIIDIPDNATGGNVTVIIDNKTYNVTNVTGSPVVVPLDNLTPGEHNITIIYVDGNGTESVVNDTITISLYDTPITIEVHDSMVGDTVKIIVNVPADIDGYIRLEIDGKVYSQKASNGQAIFEVNGLLAGNKTVTAIYEGDGKYAFNATTAMFNVSKHPAPISVSIDNSTAGKATITVGLPQGATGYVIVNVKGMDYAIVLENGNSITIPIKVTGKYTANLTYAGDDKFLSNSTVEKFSAEGIDPTQEVSIEVNNTVAGKDVVVKVTVPSDAEGNVTVWIDGENKTFTNVTGGENYINISNVSEGTHDVKVVYSGDDNYNTKTLVKTIEVFHSIIGEDNLIRGWNSPYDYKAEFLDNEGYVLKNTEVTFTVNGKEYKVKTDDQGIAYLDTSHLKVGTYEIEIFNPVTGEKVTKNTTIVDRIINNKDLVLDFADGTKYVVRAIGDDGKPVGAGEVVGFHVNGVDYNGITDSEGYARLKIELNPGSYTITAQYRAFKVSNKITVKQTLKLVKKTVTVKKSAKKLVIKAKLKWTNGKPIKGKKLTLTFKGKTYKAKTNKKGIAKFTLKKKVIKKLKKGKKYTYTVKYLTNKVKGKVKCKK